MAQGRGQVGGVDALNVSRNGAKQGLKVQIHMDHGGSLRGIELADDGDYPASLKEAVGDPVDEVGRPWPDRRNANRRSTGDLAFGIGHVGRGGFVVHQHPFNANVDHGVDHVRDFATGQAVGAFHSQTAKVARDFQ